MDAGKKTSLLVSNFLDAEQSSMLRSSIRSTIVAPTTKAIRLLSDFRILLIAETNEYLVERYTVVTRSGLDSRS